MSTGQGLLGFNMFAYCGNNPVNGCDPTGHVSITNPCSASDKYSLLNDNGSGCGCGGGGGIIVVYPLDWVADILGSATETFEEWLDAQRKEVANAAAKSLAKSVFGQSDNSTQIHHIVPQNDVRGLPAYIILQEVFPEYGVQDPRNLVQVSRRIHARLHTNLYYELVNNTITIAYLSAGDSPDKRLANVEAALQGLSYFIMTLELL